MNVHGPVPYSETTTKAFPRFRFNPSVVFTRSRCDRALTDGSPSAEP